MQETHSLNQKKLRRILVLVALVVWLLSLEALLRTKDSVLLLRWLDEVGGELFEVDYILLNVLSYGQSVLIPVAYGLYCFIADRNFGLTKLGISFWTLLLGASFALYVIRFDFSSIFYYPVIIFMFLLQLQNRKLLDTTSPKEVPKSHQTPNESR